MTPAEHYAAVARAAARRIVDNPPFAAPHGRNAFERFVDAIGHGITSVVRWIGGVLHRFVGHPISHGVTAALGSWSTPVYVVTGAVAVVVVACLVVAWRRRSRPGSPDSAATPRAERRARAARLVDEAAAAWAAGDLDTALRLRFEAGLERLEDRGVVQGRSALTTSALSAQLTSATFDDLATTHTLVAYGGVHASGADVEHAFDAWPTVVDPANARTVSR